jgi:FkbM family methyltransferase
MVFCYGAAPHCELALLDHMANRIRAVRGHVNFFDVGANVGHHTLFMADRADHVFAFEPLPRLQGLIADKIALNGLTNVQILPIGLGNQSGWFDYYPGIGANSGIGTFTTPNSADFGASVKLTVERGDDVIKKMGLPRVDLIKIDVEGFERRVLEGLSRTIQRDRPAILMELSGHSRNEFGDVSQLLNCLYDDAKIAQVNGRAGKGYVLSQFQYETSEEIIVVPGEFHGFVE